ncbi:MAG: tetratricopeptide repeat protein [Candidatus Thermoplasmatota archaeon]
MRFHLRAEELVLMHLHDLQGRMEMEQSPEATQEGIAHATGIERSYISVLMRKMEASGLLKRGMGHVKGAKRRKSVYALTPSGSALSSKIRQRLLHEELTVLDDQGRRRAKLYDVLRKDPKLSLVPLLRRICDDLLDLSPSKAVRKLPSPVSGFYGRKAELSEIHGFLKDASKSVLALTGMPGIGKTTLISASLAGIERVEWCTIEPWTTLRGMCRAIAAGLGGFHPMRRYLDGTAVIDITEAAALIEPEWKHGMVLVLDDCHNASHEVAHLLAALVKDAIRVGGKVFLIGRAIPHLYDSREVALRGQVMEMTLSGLEIESAVHILQEHGFTEEEMTEMHRRCGGHPLALQLASRAQEPISQDLERFLREEVLAKLMPEECRALRVVSMVRGATQQLLCSCADLSQDALDRLVARALLGRQGEAYTMHELLRGFFASTMTTEEAQALHRTIAEHLMGDGTPSNRLEAVRHMIEGGVEEGIHALLKNTRTWLRHGFHGEMLEVLALALPKAGSKTERAELFLAQAEIHDLVGEWNRAELLTREALALDGGNAVRAQGIFILGVLSYHRGKIEDAVKHYLEALPLAEEETMRVRIISALGVAHWRAGSRDAAKSAYEDALGIAERLCDAEGMTRALNNLGILRCEAGDHEGAMALYGRAIPIAERDGNLRTVCSLYSNVGDVYRAMGDIKMARRFYERSMVLAEELSYLWQIAELHRTMALITGDRERNQHLAKALEIFERLGAEQDAEGVRRVLAQKH